METMYLVTIFRHNKISGSNYYKTELATSDLREAKKKYHTLLSDNTIGDTFDYVMAMIADSHGNKIISEYDREETPIPTPEVTE